MKKTLTFILLFLCAASIAFWAPEFWVLQIGVKSLWLAIIAMSLIFLHSKVGMTSLAQTALGGISGYALAIANVRMGVSIPIAIVLAVVITMLIAAVLGLVVVRTTGIYFLMITLACGVAFHLFVSQARELTNGHTGISGVRLPLLAGSIDLNEPKYFYLTALILFSACYLWLRSISKSAFGIALEGVRDSPLRMRSLGYNVNAYRILAFTLAGTIAAIGGVLSVWYSGRISPGSIDVTRTVDVLVIAVIGGLFRLEGAIVGSVLFTLLSNFMNQATGRYNTAIGIVFIIVLLVAPKGLTGLIKSRSKAQIPSRPINDSNTTSTNQL